MESCDGLEAAGEAGVGLADAVPGDGSVAVGGGGDGHQAVPVEGLGGPLAPQALGGAGHEGGTGGVSSNSGEAVSVAIGIGSIAIGVGSGVGVQGIGLGLGISGPGQQN